MSRAARREHNRRVHAARRAMTDADYSQEKRSGNGRPKLWREIWDAYAAMADQVVLAAYAASQAPVSTKPARRKAPAHVQRAKANYSAAREAWLALSQSPEHGLRGGLVIGDKPHEITEDYGRYTQEEWEFRQKFPAPVFKDYLREETARLKEAA